MSVLPGRIRATPPRLAAALTLGLCTPILGACDAEEEVLDPADPIVAERSNSSLKATVNLAHVANIYRAREIQLSPLTPEIVQGLAVWGLNLGLETVYKVFGCTPMIDTDDQTYVQATFEGCSIYFLEIAGTVRADINVLSEPCDTGQCPTAVEWHIDSTNFTARNQRQEFTPSFKGEVTLTTPLVDGEPMRWETHDDFEIDLPLGRFTAKSTASWLIDDGNCVTMDLEAQLTQLEPADDLDEEIGDMVVSVRGLKQCEDACPSAGKVNLVYGAGEILQWDYTAENTVRISGPRGRHFDALLPCAD